jgi:hypothetical protein
MKHIVFGSRAALIAAAISVSLHFLVLTIYKVSSPQSLAFRF